ncbi:negative regulator of systemic acquired resistance SNI1 isoform X1 [Alnus glutinosa]|uniref:negative regulator of systemic acquired resistance SNI1 isoform X1 n=1 Tax=Alnus glutinosa TaxID=3517 RepID=UPI002D778CE8|nr:negative regulator of systemic acquired resistance SNI1 isoform X1 [Alnus glutinosa]
MESPSIWRSIGGGIEENILAILDASDARDSQDAIDDRIAFLDAVRAASIVPESGTPPTNKMFEAVFQILRVGKSLELMMASFQLLNELDKRYPRVYLSNSDKSKSSSNAPLELVVVKEAWSPFFPGLGTSSSEREAAGKDSGGPLDSSHFQLLIQELAEVNRKANFQTLDTKSLGRMLLFQYLVNVLEGDVLPRNSVHEETMKWAFLRESFLNMLLGSRKLNYKGLVRDCLAIMCGLSEIQSAFSNNQIYPENSVAKSPDTCDTAVAIALPEIGNKTCTAMQKFLILIMELDISKKKAEMQGYTTRADGVRTPLVEVILDELTYNSEILSPFLQVFNEPKWKLEIILQYFWKYTAKPSIRTRRSNGSSDDATFSGALKCFSSSTSTKGIIKKIGIEVVQLLLAHGFKAHLFLLSEQCPALGISDFNEDVRGNSLVEICKNMISAFNSMKRADEHMEVLSFGKEALFTAATILSTKT